MDDVIGTKESQYILKKKKDKFIQDAIPLIQQGMSVAKVASELNINEGTLKRWIKEYEKENGPIRGKTAKSLHILF